MHGLDMTYGRTQARSGLGVMKPSMNLGNPDSKKGGAARSPDLTLRLTSITPNDYIP
jgi:hypothetical protein